MYLQEAVHVHRMTVSVSGHIVLHGGHDYDADSIAIAVPYAARVILDGEKTDLMDNNNPPNDPSVRIEIQELPGANLALADALRQVLPLAFSYKLFRRCEQALTAAAHGISTPREQDDGTPESSDPDRPEADVDPDPNAPV